MHGSAPDSAQSCRESDLASGGSVDEIGQRPDGLLVSRREDSANVPSRTSGSSCRKRRAHGALGVPLVGFALGLAVQTVRRPRRCAAPANRATWKSIPTHHRRYLRGPARRRRSERLLARRHLVVRWALRCRGGSGRPTPRRWRSACSRLGRRTRQGRSRTPCLWAHAGHTHACSGACAIPSRFWHAAHRPRTRSRTAPRSGVHRRGDEQGSQGPRQYTNASCRRSCSRSLPVRRRPPAISCREEAHDTWSATRPRHRPLPRRGSRPGLRLVLGAHEAPQPYTRAAIGTASII